MMISDTHAADSWASLVNSGERLSPAQYQAFQQAIAQVKQRLYQVLNRPQAQRQGQFELDSFVDSLHADFLAEDTRAERRDIGHTAFLVTRFLADRLLELQRQLPPQPAGK